MFVHIRPALVMLALFTALTGIIYPLAMTGVAQVLIPGRANGSLIVQGDKVVGSELIGQLFADGKYFHARPSAAGDGYNAASSSGSNLGPLSQKLLDRVKTEADALRSSAPGSSTIPADAATASASGLDPHISPAFAELQIARVAAARGVPADQLRKIVVDAVEHPDLSIVGEPRVNVLRLNLALDAALAGRSG